MEKLLREILNEIKPLEEEIERERGIYKEIKEIIEENGVKCVLVGSLAKGTDLRGDKDIDIFIKFPEDLSREELEENGLRIGMEVFKRIKVKPEIDYAEHPYVRGTYKGYNVDIVPCYDTKNPKSAVDRTPYHTEYVMKKLRENKGMGDEIRLLKQFMKGINVYGAEARVEGFSGYLTELLVINYGSFLDTLRAVSKWKFREVIDLENLWGNEELPRYFFPDSSLIVIDPVDENRNVAAAVSVQRLSEFIVNAREFLRSPRREFFFPKKRDVPSKKIIMQKISERKTKLVAVHFNHKGMNENLLYSQLRKTINSIIKSIEKFNFKTIKQDIWADDEIGVMLFEFEIWKLPRIVHHYGPSIYSSGRDQEKFLRKYEMDKPYIEGYRWVVDKKRRFSRIEDAMNLILERKDGFGKNLRRVEFKISINDEILSIEKEEFFRFLAEFLRI
ncbi:MAG: CCA tRNA nucleotidyltransferase [Candidatus Altiarchaeales archaeon]|nr:MAG: CCA tRNA nucleotidyltransferase [Candidatus Altiarchaeales archaeon]RLI95294.1 MAG: CCA tRNA nucleotidyltransferase [Candidatus Altiarchaeales archaeon]RLI95520.1 MAG: CCA tRNA nucleotidyltransferase [Candidatus Altiarchaeales archaeon]HDO82281.1 CCA tRNA nucleotidyltransferase [Candidatus Altiarchaeales archaeon]HEX54930.1 CCA tRNA nucleotidyltransferase [Candidatus Altiarchaeales archaeon]